MKTLIEKSIKITGVPKLNAKTIFNLNQISTLSEYDFKVEKIIELVKEYENNNGYSLKEFWPIIDNLKKIDQTTQNYKLLIELAQHLDKLR